MRLKSAIAFCLLLLLVACSKENRWDCFRSNGKDITEDRGSQRFDSLEVRDNFDVIISTGAAYKVEITAGEHIIKNIITEIKNGELVIENRNKCNFVRGYKRKFKVHITTPKLVKLFNNTVGPVTFQDFKQDTLRIRAGNSGDTFVNGDFDVMYTSSHGNGDIYFNGTAREMIVYTNGINFIRARDFKVSQHIFVATYSIGDCYFNLDGVGLFEYYIWRDGSIYYSGTPSTLTNLGDNSAKGTLVKED